jgi:hypothetical protein
MNQRKIQLERRHFLQMVGASALTYPFLRGVPSYAAASGTAPTYMVLVFTPCGCVRPLWGATDASGNDVLPPAYGSAPTVNTNFIFRNTLTPFASGGTVGGASWTTNLQSKVIILDGLNNRAAQGSHEAGMASLWTGQISSGSAATSISIDQQIAAQLNAGTPFPSIQLMVRAASDYTDRSVQTRMLYNAAGVFIDPIDTPLAARQNLFGNVTPTAGPDKTTFIRQQLFGGGAGQLNSELTALMPKVCSADRAQLQALQDGWNNLDTQLKAAATATANCTAPETVPAGTLDYPTSAKLQMDILAMALACDLTRVASLQFSTATSQVTHTWLGSNQAKCHHDYSHEGPQSLYALAPYSSSGTYNIYGASNLNLYNTAVPPSLAMQKAIDNWYATQVAYLAQRLNSLTGAGSGTTLLDQSVICWGSELDMGAAHNHDDTPFILVGGANGKLKTGQMVTFPLDLTDGDSKVAAAKDRAHNDLLLTLAQAMGAAPSSGKFGEPTYCTGPIAQILNS